MSKPLKFGIANLIDLSINEAQNNTEPNKNGPTVGEKNKMEYGLKTGVKDGPTNEKKNELQTEAKDETAKVQKKAENSRNALVHFVKAFADKKTIKLENSGLALLTTATEMFIRELFLQASKDGVVDLDYDKLAGIIDQMGCEGMKAWYPKKVTYTYVEYLKQQAKEKEGKKIEIEKSIPSSSTQLVSTSKIPISPSFNVVDIRDAKNFAVLNNERPILPLLFDVKPMLPPHMVWEILRKDIALVKTGQNEGQLRLCDFAYGLRLVLEAHTKKLIREPLRPIRADGFVEVDDKGADYFDQLRKESLKSLNSEIFVHHNYIKQPTEEEEKKKESENYPSTSTPTVSTTNVRMSLNSKIANDCENYFAATEKKQNRRVLHYLYDDMVETGLYPSFLGYNQFKDSKHDGIAGSTSTPTMLSSQSTSSFHDSEAHFAATDKQQNTLTLPALFDREPLLPPNKIWEELNKDALLNAGDSRMSTTDFSSGLIRVLYDLNHMFTRDLLSSIIVANKDEYDKVARVIDHLGSENMKNWIPNRVPYASSSISKVPMPSSFDGWEADFAGTDKQRNAPTPPDLFDSEELPPEAIFRLLIEDATRPETGKLEGVISRSDFNSSLTTLLDASVMKFIAEEEEEKNNNPHCQTNQVP